MLLLCYFTFAAKPPSLVTCWPPTFECQLPLLGRYQRWTISCVYPNCFRFYRFFVMVMLLLLLLLFVAYFQEAFLCSSPERRIFVGHKFKHDPLLQTDSPNDRAFPVASSSLVWEFVFCQKSKIFRNSIIRRWLLQNASFSRRRSLLGRPLLKQQQQQLQQVVQLADQSTKLTTKAMPATGRKIGHMGSLSRDVLMMQQNDGSRTVQILEQEPLPLTDLARSWETFGLMFFLCFVCLSGTAGKFHMWTPTPRAFVPTIQKVVSV